MSMAALSCPACSAPEFASLGRGLYACSYCGTTFRRLDSICPACGRPVDETAELCPHCGEPLSIVGSVIARQARPLPPRWLATARTNAPALKAEAEAGSRVRMDALWEIDHRRERAAAEDAERRRHADRRILTGAAIVAGLLMLFFLALAAARAFA